MGLDENQENIKKEILGPSWAPKKNDIIKRVALEKDVLLDKEITINENSNLTGKIMKKKKNNQ